jgi:hypothetical protein
MPARRDYAAAWRDSAALLAQVPVAGLQATGFFYQQWLECSSSYLSLVTTRLALARRLAGDDTTPDKGVMATVLSEDLFDETRTLVQKLVLLPGEAASRFNITLEDLSRAVLARVQPDAQTDVRTYVGNELEELGQELNHLQEVAKAERARRKAAGRPGRDPEAEPPGDLEKLLDGVQERIDRVLTHFSRKPLPPRRPDLTVQQQRVIAAHLKIEKAQEEERLGKKELREARAGAAKRRAGGKRKRRKYRPGGARKRAGG